MRGCRLEFALQERKFGQVAQAHCRFFGHVPRARFFQRTPEPAPRIRPAAAGEVQQAQVLVGAHDAVVVVERDEGLACLLPEHAGIVVIAQLVVGEADVVEALRGALRIVGGFAATQRALVGGQGLGIVAALFGQQAQLVVHRGGAAAVAELFEQRAGFGQVVLGGVEMPTHDRQLGKVAQAAGEAAAVAQSAAQVGGLAVLLFRVFDLAKACVPHAHGIGGLGLAKGAAPALVQHQRAHQVFFDGFAVVALQDGGLAQQEPGTRVLRVARQQLAQHGNGRIETAGIDFQFGQLQAGVEVVGTCLHLGALLAQHLIEAALVEVDDGLQARLHRRSEGSAAPRRVFGQGMLAGGPRGFRQAQPCRCEVGSGFCQ